MKQKPLSSLAIGDKIRKQKPFWVRTSAERKSALTAAKYAGVEVSTRAKNGGFAIYFLTSSIR